MTRLLAAATFVLALPTFGAAMPMTEVMAAAEVVFDFGALLALSEDAAPDASVFAVETLVISEAVESLSLENGSVFSEVVAASTDNGISSSDDWLSLPVGETGGASAGGGSPGGGSIPTPSALLLVGSGLLGILFVRRFLWR